MPKRCFGEYNAFNDECEHCHELEHYCRMWKKNMLNFKRKRNLTTFICFLIIIAWNIKIGLDFIKTNSTLFTILDFSALLLFFLALKASIKSRKTAMGAYDTYVRSIKNG
jgi:hypothetical protein